MFEWLRRRGGAPSPAARAKAQPKSAAPPRSRPARLAEPPPVPEVVAEGNTQADWSLWEDSMTALDSQLQGIDPSARVQVRDDTRPSQLDDVDAFAGVRQKRPR